MVGENKTHLTETDIITKYILPAVKGAGWDVMSQVRQEVKLRDGKIVVRGKLASRIKVKSADIVLYHKPNLPLAVIEAKANKHAISKGMQQGLDYANLLDVPFIFASNGDGFIFHDKTNPQQLESEIALSDFQRQNSSGRNTVSGKAIRKSNYRLSARTITMTAAENLPVIIRCRQLTGQSMQFQRVITAFFWLWQPVQVKPIPHSR
jgi:type I site-specific restriction endonuclease